MHDKRTTAPDGIRGVTGPPHGRPVHTVIPPERRITPAGRRASPSSWRASAGSCGTCRRSRS